MEFQKITEYLPFYCEDINKLLNKDSPYIHEYRNEIVFYKFDRTFAIHMHDLLLYLNYGYINLLDGQRLNLMFQIVCHYYNNYQQKKYCLGNLNKRNIWIVLQTNSNKFSPVLQTVFYDVVFVNDQVKQFKIPEFNQNLIKLIESDFMVIKDIVVRLNSYKYSVIKKQDIQEINSIQSLYEYLLKVMNNNYDQVTQKLDRGWFVSDQARNIKQWLDIEKYIKKYQLIQKLNVNQSLFQFSLQYQLIQQYKLQNYQKYFGEFIYEYIQEYSIGLGKDNNAIQSQIQNIIKELDKLFEPIESNQITAKVQGKFKEYFELTIEKIEGLFQTEFKWTEPNQVIKKNEDSYYQNFNADILKFYLANKKNQNNDFSDGLQFINGIQENTWKQIFNGTLEMIKKEHQEEIIKQTSILINSLQ